MDRIFDILLVEDNDADAYLTRTVIEDSPQPIQLSVVRDGAEAMAYLAAFAEAARPDLILLDLNMPRKTGLEVLAEIRGDDLFRQIPVAVFTTSERAGDVTASYELGANCYLTKPVSLVDFKAAVHHLVAFWCETVRLPYGAPVGARRDGTPVQ